MPLTFEIPDKDLTGFNNRAQEVLKAATSEFIQDLILESNRIESGTHTTEGLPEITSSMVNDAKISILRGLAVPKKSLKLKIVGIAGVVLTGIAGLMYDTIKLQDSDYMASFVVLVVAAILCITISTIKE